jgi:hypothetical protein
MHSNFFGHLLRFAYQLDIFLAWINSSGRRTVAMLLLLLLLLILLLSDRLLENESST